MTPVTIDQTEMSSSRAPAAISGNAGQGRPRQDADDSFEDRQPPRPIHHGPMRIAATMSKTPSTRAHAPNSRTKGHDPSLVAR